MNKKKIMTQITTKDVTRSKRAEERLLYAAIHDAEQLYERFGSSNHGLSALAVDKANKTYGKNIVTHGKKDTRYGRICNKFINPLGLLSRGTFARWGKWGANAPADG